MVVTSCSPTSLKLTMLLRHGYDISNCNSNCVKSTLYFVFNTYSLLNLGKLQIAAVCFQVYYFYRSQASKEEFDRVRQRDGLPMFITMFQTFYILICVSINAAGISQQVQ